MCSLEDPFFLYVCVWAHSRQEFIYPWEFKDECMRIRFFYRVYAKKSFNIDAIMRSSKWFNIFSSASSSGNISWIYFGNIYLGFISFNMGVIIEWAQISGILLVVILLSFQLKYHHYLQFDSLPIVLEMTYFWLEFIFFRSDYTFWFVNIAFINMSLLWFLFSQRKLVILLFGLQLLTHGELFRKSEKLPMEDISSWWLLRICGLSKL